MFEFYTGPLLETIYMVFFSALFSTLLGLPLGILLVITEKENIWEKPSFNSILNSIINVLRSIPFIILMLLVFPLSKLIVGTRIGTTASIVPLSIAAAPFVARLIETSLREVDKGVIESSLAMGASPYEIVTKVLLSEALPSIVSGLTNAVISLVGYSAMAGAIGAGGLGDLAIRYGHYKHDPLVMYISVIIIVVLVQGIQFAGNKLSLKLNKKI